MSLNYPSPPHTQNTLLILQCLNVLGLNGGMLDIGCKDGGQLVYLLPAQRTGNNNTIAL